MRKALLKAISVALLGAWLTMGGATRLYGQESETDEFMLEPVTVTAQKRSENKQKVAIGMDVISSEEIKYVGTNSIDDMLSNISNVTIQKAADGLRISIRGMADTTDSPNNQSSAAPTVAVNVDGVTSNRKDTGIGLFDIERVEVLFGPQSTLYATNSPGGIVNIVTANPKLDKTSGSVLVKYGSYNLISSEGMMNVPLSDTMALRMAFSSSEHDGYIENTHGDGEDLQSVRLKGLYQPADNVSFVLTAETSKDKSSGYAGGVVPFIDEDDRDDPWTGAETGTLGYNDQNRSKISGNFNWEMNFASLSVVPSYSEGDGSRRIVQSGDDTSVWQDNNEKNLEIRLASSDDSFLKWLVGYIYYESEDNNTQLSQDYIDTGAGDWSIRSIDQELTSLYGNVTFPVTDGFRLNAGLRRGTDEYTQTQQRNTLTTDGYDTLNISGIMEAPSNPDWMFGVEYDLSDSTMLYASYTKSYRLQLPYRGTMLTEPEVLKAYSAGSKSRFFNNRLELNTSLYYYDYTDYMCRRVISVWVDDLDGDLDADMNEYADEPNAAAQGDGRMYGFDIQASMVTSINGRLDLSVSYEESEWTDMFFDFSYETQKAVVNGELVDVPVTDENYNGEAMVLTPPWTITLSYRHDFILANNGFLEAKIDTRYQTGYRLTWQKSDYPYNYQETYHIENLSLRYTPPEGGWALTGYMNNIFNYAQKRMYSSEKNGFMSIGEPRTFGAVLSLNF